MTLALDEETKMVEVGVEDTGCGIKEEDKNALFKLFGRPN